MCGHSQLTRHQFFPEQREVRVQALQGRGYSDSEHGLWETLGQNPPTQKIRPLSVLSSFIKKAKQDIMGNPQSIEVLVIL